MPAAVLAANVGLVGAAHFVIVSVGSLAMGVLGGLLGVGGGVFLVPWLVMAAGVGAREAVGVSLLCVIATSAASSYVAGRRGDARLDVSLRLEPFLVVGALVASAMGVRVAEGPLLVGFAVFILIVAALVWVRGRFAGVERPPGLPVERHGIVNALAALSGAASGLFGVGGGVLLIPGLVLLGRMPVKEAATTSSLCLMSSAAAGAVVHLTQGGLPVDVVAIAVVGVLPGGLWGARLQQRVSARTLETTFMVLALAVAVLTALKGFA
ncbi:MAG: sulfite exporter TauE/SafE family protein [Deltaproteobacteria bacterium]|nr:sulfite exporter TauE/SafE family protein [Deltaproteobacteria bacterium]